MKQKRASRKNEAKKPDAAPSWQLGPLPPVSVPGGPSAHPDRPPVPPRPGLAEQWVGQAFFGKTEGSLKLFRPAPVQEGGQEIDMCAGCDVDCCTGHFIPINLFDAWRIRSVLNIPFQEFLALIPHHAGIPTHPVRIGNQKGALILKRRADRSCGFLLRVGSQRRCGIHALRPDACRIFPFVADMELQRGQGEGALLQMHPSHCPWRWPNTPEHRARVLQDIVENESHRQLDREVLSTWFWAMGIPKTPENFFAFLEEELTRRMLRPDEPSRYRTRLW